MYSLETVESLHAYADRLHRDAARTTPTLRRRSAARALVLRVRRSA